MNGDCDVVMPVPHTWELFQNNLNSCLAIYPAVSYGFAYQYAKTSTSLAKDILDIQGQAILTPDEKRLAKIAGWEKR